METLAMGLIAWVSSFYFLWELLGTFLIYAVMIVPYAAGSYIAYWGRLKVSRTRFITLVFLAFILQGFVYAFAPSDAGNALFFFFCVINFIIYICTVKANFWHKLFIFMTFMQFAANTRAISFFLETNFLELSGNEYAIDLADPAVPFFVLELLIACAAMVFIGLILKKYIVPLMDKVPVRQARILSFVPLIFLTIVLTVTMLMQNQLGSFAYLGLIIATCLGDIVIYFVVFLMFKGMADSAELREENMMYGFREQYYALLSARIEESRKLRHDFRHHMQVLNSLLKKRDYDKLAEYLDEYANVSDGTGEIQYCENYVVNMILCHFAQIARDAEIEFACTVVFPEYSFVKNVDLCALLSNSLENAIDSCTRQKDGARWIRTSIKATMNEIVFAIDNSCDHIHREGSGEFLSTKTGRLGTGLLSIRSVAKKYGGSAWFEYQEGAFQTSVVLYRLFAS